MILINFRNKDTGLIINSIEKSYENDYKLSTEFIEEAKVKANYNKNKNSNDYFILGYINLNTYNNEKLASSYFKKVIKYANDKTYDFAMLYSYNYLSNYEIDNKDIDKAIYYANKSFDSIKPIAYGRYKKIIWHSFRDLLDYEKGREVSLDSYDRIIKYLNLMDDESRIYVLKRWTTLNTILGKHVNAINGNLQVIELSKEVKDNENLYRSIIELGLIAREMGQYDAAIKIIDYKGDMNIKNEELTAQLNCYKYINLSEIEIILGNYDKAINYINKTDMYEKNLKKEDLDDVKILKNIIKAQYNIKENNLDSAQEYLKKAKIMLDEDKYTFFVDKNIDYYLTLGNLNTKERNYDEAIKNYNKAIEISDERLNAEYKEIGLKLLVKLYEKIGDKESKYKYEDKLLEVESKEDKTFSDNYYDNVLYRYKNEKTIHETSNMKMKNMFLKVIIITLTSILFIFNIYPNIRKYKLKSKIRKYIKENKYILNYQPVVNPKNSQIVGFESLIRLEINEKLIMPKVILKEIELCDLTGEIAIWILNKIIKDYEEIKKIGNLSKDFYISMNISLKDIEDNVFFDELKKSIEKINIPRNVLCIEITENNNYKDENIVRERICKIKEYGISIALDDFGTEYSNVCMLGRFEFDAIKIDKYFIDHINESPINSMVIESADYLSCFRNKTIIVEGVETKEQMEVIKNTLSKKVYIQGYYYSKPLNLTQLKSFNINKK
ncbi:EAL domain-containing protein [Paraclostridium bifermentans]|uniref:EAL domain-containing protein n=1 Tax=Paraclostridium bifermentans TaxID=1490 RepID=UPI00359C2A9D